MDQPMRETPTSKAIREIIEHAYIHGDMWRDKGNLYWLIRLLEEVTELILSLAGIHKDDPEWEIKQIATIAINWLAHRREGHIK